MSIKKLTGFAVVTAADGKRVSYNWTELDQDVHRHGRFDYLSNQHH